jgi:DNA processing protein
MKSGILLINRNDSNFPANLFPIPGKLPLLYALGNTALLQETLAVAVVGTQSPDEKGETACRRITGTLVNRGFVIVSGLASGCDSIAHESCLALGGKTIAVLAHGLDYCYPQSNRNLRDRILEKGGLLVSEYAEGVRPRRNFFVARDRIESGLTRGLIVIQSGVTGGSMHTARFAEKQNRPIASISGLGGGNEQLLNEKGAYPLDSDEDLEKFIQIMMTVKITAAGSEQNELF